MNNHHKYMLRRRIIALLDREQMEFLDRLGMDALFSTGRKLSRVDIISALVDAARELELSADGIKSKRELIQRFLKAVCSPIDRRRYPRLKKNLVVGFRKMDSMSQYKYSTVTDVGMGGFRMDVGYVDKPPAVHQVIEVTLREPKGKEPVKAIGRIAWIREKEHEHSIEVGVMLTYISKEDGKKFVKYLTEEANNAEDEKQFADKKDNKTEDKSG